MSKPINDIWKDPSVKAALKEGRSANDIAVFSCPKCNRWNYYNQGSHFYCRFCRKGWGHGNLEYEYTTLADTVTVVTDGYENQTLANPRD